jgi:hypothetical protein
MVLALRKPSGIAVATAGAGGKESNSNGSFASRDRVVNATVDGAACVSSYVLVMEAETVLVEAPPVWAVAEITTSVLCLASCPVVLGSDLMTSDNTMQQVQSVSGIFSPGGMAGAVIADLTGADPKLATDIGNAIGDGVLLLRDFKNLDVTDGLKDFSLLGADTLVVGKELYDLYHYGDASSTRSSTASPVGEDGDSGEMSGSDDDQGSEVDDRNNSGSGQENQMSSDGQGEDSDGQSSRGSEEGQASGGSANPEPTSTGGGAGTGAGGGESKGGGGGEEEEPDFRLAGLRAPVGNIGRMSIIVAL